MYFLLGHVPSINPTNAKFSHDLAEFLFPFTFLSSRDLMFPLWSWSR